MNKQNNTKEIKTHLPRPRENYAEWNVSLKLNLIEIRLLIITKYKKLKILTFMI